MVRQWFKFCWCQQWIEKSIERDETPEDENLSTREACRMDFVTHQPIRSPLYGSSIGMPNLLWRIPFRRIVRNTVTCGMVTLMTEVKSIINSRPLIMVKLMPLPPRNLLTMKTNVGMPPPVEFSRPNLYSERGWYCVQHIANSGTDGEKNFPRSSNLNITGKQGLKFQNWEYCIAKGWRPLQSVVFGKSHQC